MSEAKRPRIVKFSREKLELSCEWDDCEITCDKMCSFLSHMNDHMSVVTEDDMLCKWKDCGAILKSTTELYRHVMYHAFHTKIKCYGKNFLERNEFPHCSFDSQIRNIIPELPDSFLCLWLDCNESFDSPEAFYRHVDTHAEDYDSNEAISCRWKDCKSSLKTRTKLKDHLRSHTQERLMACSICGGTFASRTKFQDHILRQAAAQVEDGQHEGFQCGYCFQKFASERLLRDHMRHHVNHYKCPYCDMTCPNPSAVHTHITYRHSNEKPYACEYCEYKAKYQKDLNKHMEVHDASPAFKCPTEDCGFSSHSRTTFNTHMKDKHEDSGPKLYKCHICDKNFSRGNYLSKHLIGKHNFHLPSGHSRFRYLCHEDGFLRLQTVRYESIELSETFHDDTDKETKDCPVVQTVVTDAKDNEHVQILQSEFECGTSNEVIVDNIETGETIQASVLPVLMYVAGEKGNGHESSRQLSADEIQSVVLEVQNVGDTSNSSEVQPSEVVYLNLPKSGENFDSVRTIQLIKKLNGETVIQTAEVIASASDKIMDTNGEESLDKSDSM